MKTLKDIENLSGVTVLLRADLNVPIEKGQVRDDFRLKMSIPTMDFLRSRGAKLVIVSHIESLDKGSATLKPAITRLSELAGAPIGFIENYRNAKTEIDALAPGEMVALENLRNDPGEKDNDANFAKSLASLADIYVNDAFAVAHRKHASVCAITRYIPSFAGLLLEREVSELSRAFKPGHPFVFILGGAKFSTKLQLISKFLKSADKVFIGGALANDCFKALGYEVGKSQVASESVDLKAVVENPKTVVPIDVVVKRGDSSIVVPSTKVEPGDIIVDVGPQSIINLGEVIDEAKFVLWNGPMGNYEIGFDQATLGLAKVIASRSGQITSIIGGGDTVAATAKLGIDQKFSFISTGGGAMLDFLANETLPALEALEKGAE